MTSAQSLSAPGPVRLEDWLRADRATRDHAVQLCVERIRERDAELQAWVQVLPQPGEVDGPLAGIPFGAKDVIETQNLATEYGSPLYQGRRGAFNAAIIRLLQEQGAVLLGKTQTAAFAHRTPPPTRNPRNLEHTPGGSSSGSAAAVAAGMVPFALGTQTLGSVVRPASFCGVTGFKPTHGLFSMEGVLSMSPSLDTLGFFTHTPSDMLRLWEALGREVAGDSDLTFGAVDPLPELEPPMADTFRATIASLRNRGGAVEALAIAPLLENLAQETRIVMHYEGARFHEQRYRRFGDRLLDLADLVREGLEIPDSRYREALTAISEGKQQMAACYRSTPVIFAPSAAGPAPRGLGSTGDPRPNAPWTALGVPAISIPMPVADGLPLGLQLSAAPGDDARLLQAALQIDRLFQHHS
jgi:Asp-tRNA(Asn)/Glu-tRNA(Gln) amidotransferase A subunit family amidase